MTSPSTHALLISNFPAPEMLSGMDCVTKPLEYSSGQTSAVLKFPNDNLDMQSLMDRFGSLCQDFKKPDGLGGFVIEMNKEFQAPDLSSKQLMPTTLPIKKRFLSKEENALNISSSFGGVEEQSVTKKLKFDHIKNDDLCYGKSITSNLSLLATVVEFYSKRTVVIADEHSGTPFSDVHDETNNCNNIETVDSDSQAEAPSVVPNQISLASEGCVEEEPAQALNDSVEISPNGSDVEAASPKRATRRGRMILGKSPSVDMVFSNDKEEAEESEASEDDEEAHEEPSDEEYSSEDGEEEPRASSPKGGRSVGSRARLAAIVKPKHKPARLSKAQSAILEAWLMAHQANPFPNRREKIELCERAACEMKQLTNWFYNARKTRFSKRPKKQIK